MSALQVDIAMQRAVAIRQLHYADRESNEFHLTILAEEVLRLRAMLESQIEETKIAAGIPVDSSKWLTEIPQWNGCGWMRQNLNAAGYSDPEPVCFVNGSVERGGSVGLWSAEELNGWEFWTGRLRSPS